MTEESKKSSDELMVIGQTTAVQVFADSAKVDDILSKIETEARAEVLDISTPGGRKRIASLAHKIAKSKTHMDGMGKDLNEGRRAKIDAVDAERRKIRDRLDALKEEIRKPLTEWEDAEKTRVSEHESNIAAMNEWRFTDADAGVDTIEKHMGLLDDLFKKRDWQEFADRATETYDRVRDSLVRVMGVRKKQDAEQAELERLRKEQEARETKEREDRIAREAAEKAKAEAEEKAKVEREAVEKKAKEAREAAEKKRQEEIAKAERKAQEEREEAARIQKETEDRAKAAEQAKTDAEAQAKRDVEDAAEKERQRIDAEQRAETKAAEDREADKKHKSKINNAALESFVKAGISKADGKKAIEAIAKHQIPNVTISY